MEQDSITPSLDGEVWLKSIRYPAANRTVRVQFDGEDVTIPARLGLNDIVGKASPIATFDQRGSRETKVVISTTDRNEAALIELLLMVSGELLLHVPADSTVPGGYLAAKDATRSRSTAGAPYRWALPYRLVEPPGPDVVGSTLVWGTVRRLYGSWTAVRAAHPEWGPLLDTVGAPDDPVVW